MNKYKHAYVPDHPKASNSGYVHEHIIVAEKALGKYLPEDAIIHHVNNRRGVNRNTNLVICENQAYHMLLHRRMRVLKAGGDPNTQKICSKCKEVKSFENFCCDEASPDKYYHICISCKAVYDKIYRVKRTNNI